MGSPMEPPFNFLAAFSKRYSFCVEGTLWGEEIGLS